MEASQKEGGEIESDNNSEDNHDGLEEEAHYMMKDTHYSYNLADIKFPLHSCPEQKSDFNKKQNGTFIFPSYIMPVFDENRTCRKHKNKYRKHDNFAKLGTRYVINYHNVVKQFTK